MSQHVNPLLLLFFFLFIQPCFSSVDGFVYGGCSQTKYANGSPFLSSLNNLLTSIVNSAIFTPYSNFTSFGSNPQDTIYGLYQCTGDLSAGDCASCVRRAAAQIVSFCRSACGAVLQLEGCFIKYDNATFLGVPDKTLVMKKCGDPIHYDMGFYGRRDRVLSGLVYNTGSYRIESSDYVHGIAQCTGDLTIGECSDCVSDATQRLKILCDSAESGDIYFAKCHARYFTGGNLYKPGISSSKDGNSKIWAIIIGTLALVVLFIIFLYFIGRSSEIRILK